MKNSTRSLAVREFTRATGCQTINQGNDLLIRVGGQYYDFQLALPKIKTLNKNYAWDSDHGNITGCQLEVFSNQFTEDVVLRICVGAWSAECFIEDHVFTKKNKKCH